MWLQNQIFQKVIQLYQIPHSFLFSHLRDALNTSRNLTLVGHKNITTQSYVPNLTKFCLWCVQLKSTWDTHKVICKQRINTLSTSFITQVWKWLSPKDLHHITPTSPRKHACNNAILFFFPFSFEAFFLLLLTNVQ